MHQQSHQLDEQLSAILDGEASELELRRFLQRLDELDESQRSALYKQWDRYQRISAGLAGEPIASRAAPAFVEQLASRLADEQPEPLNRPQSLNTRAAPVNGTENRSTSIWSKLAVAASFALAVTVGFQQLHINNQSEQLQLAANVSDAQREQSVTLPGGQLPDAGQGVQVASTTDPLATNDGAIDQQERQRRLQEYLMEHANRSAQQNGQGIVPFARTASFEAE